MSRDGRLDPLNLAETEYSTDRSITGDPTLIIYGDDFEDFVDGLIREGEAAG